MENPFSTRIKLDAIVPADVQIRLFLFDEKGRKLKENLSNLKKGLNQIYFDNLEGIVPGIYILSAEMPNENFRFKVVKK
ncbi:MAG: T9SS type A sorting domain-containing protein [Chitinophagaceae bacterium]|nr:T9SS type A sorting domain-containing protein [Chitinophagaceae bacterium]